jgi:hypothetical protein
LRKHLKFIFALLGCLHLVGGPYALVQIYAWSTMFAGYSQEAGFLQGAKDTFSGERPCHLCSAIAAVESQDSEQNKPVLPEKSRENLKIVQELLLGEHVELHPPAGLPVMPVTHEEVTDHYRDYISLPPTPPPRSCA